MSIDILCRGRSTFFSKELTRQLCDVIVLLRRWLLKEFSLLSSSQASRLQEGQKLVAFSAASAKSQRTEGPWRMNSLPFTSPEELGKKAHVLPLPMLMGLLWRLRIPVSRSSQSSTEIHIPPSQAFLLFGCSHEHSPMIGTSHMEVHEFLLCIRRAPL